MHNSLFPISLCYCLLHVSFDPIKVKCHPREKCRESFGSTFGMMGSIGNCSNNHSCVVTCTLKSKIGIKIQLVFRYSRPFFKDQYTNPGNNKRSSRISVAYAFVFPSTSTNENPRNSKVG